ncbi:MAG: hypothetical protein ACD_45C00124G0004 [uncultured bacterium]|nr:MAG: hypothetical protein ACD_45C00124G0004 [uncultured bacterium]
MKRIIKIVFIITLLSSMICMAEEYPPVPVGWYVEGNLGSSRLTNTNYVSGANGSPSSSGVAWNVNGGYKFMPYFATEAGYTKYSGATSKASGTTVAKNSSYSYDVAAKGMLLLGDSNADLFAKIGVARLNSNVTIRNQSFVTANGITVNNGKSRTTGYYFGLGIEYSFWSNFLVNTQWQRARGNTHTGNMDLFSIGAGYIFG